MNAAWTLLTAPVIEPITTANAKAHLRVDVADDDALIDRLVKGARAQVEAYLHRGLVTQTWKYLQDEWTDAIWLPMAAPLQSVTAVQYYDTAGALQTLATSTYLVQTTPEPGRIVLAPDKTWPNLQDRALAVEITYVLGWSAIGDILSDIIDALYLLVGHRYLQRGDEEDPERLPAAVEALLAPHRVWWREPKVAA